MCGASSSFSWDLVSQHRDSADRPFPWGGVGDSFQPVLILPSDHQWAWASGLAGMGSPLSILARDSTVSLWQVRGGCV